MQLGYVYYKKEGLMRMVIGVTLCHVEHNYKLRNHAQAGWILSQEVFDWEVAFVLRWAMALLKGKLALKRAES